MEKPFYKRVLLKLSGEALMGEQEFGISSDVIASYARQIKEIADLGVEVSVVIGGGFFGPLGMLLASPTAATIKIYYGKLLDKNKDIIDELTDYDHKKMNVKKEKCKNTKKEE